MLDLANHDPEFIETIITGDETWIYAILKPSLNFYSGSIWDHHDQKKLGKFAAT